VFGIRKYLWWFQGPLAGIGFICALTVVLIACDGACPANYFPKALLDPTALTVTFLGGLVLLVINRRELSGYNFLLCGALLSFYSYYEVTTRLPAQINPAGHSIAILGLLYGSAIAIVLTPMLAWIRRRSLYAKRRI